MTTRARRLVKPRLNSTRADDVLQRTVRELYRETTLREVAERLGVCHATVWKLLKGQRMRPSTIRRIKDGVTRAAGATDFDLLASGLQGVLAPLPEPKRREARRFVARALAEWYMHEGLLVPGWIAQLRRTHGASVQMPSMEGRGA
jgi:AcrR family transcriptional regulator